MSPLLLTATVGLSCLCPALPTTSLPPSCGTVCLSVHLSPWPRPLHAHLPWRSGTEHRSHLSSPGLTHILSQLRLWHRDMCDNRSTHVAEWAHCSKLMIASPLAPSAPQERAAHISRLELILCLSTSVPGETECAEERRAGVWCVSVWGHQSHLLSLDWN